MKAIKVLLMFAIFTGSGIFFTGCRAHAANFSSSSYSFTIMQGVVFSNPSPANNAIKVDSMKPIEFDITQADGLPITNVTVTVTANGSPITPQSITLNPIPNGFHCIFVPEVSYPINSTITWSATAQCVGN